MWVGGSGVGCGVVVMYMYTSAYFPDVDTASIRLGRLYR